MTSLLDSTAIPFVRLERAYDALVRCPELSAGKRLLAASLAGRMGAIVAGRFSSLDRDGKIAAIREVTDDPEILGQVMGPYLVGEYSTDGQAVELLRAAGADERVAARNAEWQRWRLRRLQAGDRYADSP